MLLDVLLNELTIHDINAPPIVLSHLQKCKIVKNVVIDHRSNTCTYTDPNDDFVSDVSSEIIASDLSSDSDMNSEDWEHEHDNDAHHLISMFNYQHLSHQECETVFDTCSHLMMDCVTNTPTHFTNPAFHSMFEATIYSATFATLAEQTFFHLDLKREINHIIRVALKQFFQRHVPVRSFPDTRILYFLGSQQKERLMRQINVLRDKPQPEQRTPAWYDFRNNLITASNAYKIWESDKMQNSLIYEKCKATATDEDSVLAVAAKSAMFTNTSSPMHWGQKYEPVSVAIYEHMYQTKIEEFGCIRHDSHSFVGASPDGINVDPESPRFGRMLEIKNIVNREINGIPKKEYWVQMQLQMEVCGLEECDFFETRFKEYESYHEFKEDWTANHWDADDDTIDQNKDGVYRGLVIHFAFRDLKTGYMSQTPVYEYCPPTYSLKEMDAWEEQTCVERKKAGYEWVQNMYWKLEEYSCVLVCRNHLWFQHCVADIAKIWKVIEAERETGYAHRAPTSRKPKVGADGLVAKKTYKGDLPANKCFIKVKKLD